MSNEKERETSTLGTVGAVGGAAVVGGGAALGTAFGLDIHNLSKLPEDLRNELKLLRLNSAERIINGSAGITNAHHMLEEAVRGGNPTAYKNLLTKIKDNSPDAKTAEEVFEKVTSGLHKLSGKQKAGVAAVATVAVVGAYMGLKRLFSHEKPHDVHEGELGNLNSGLGNLEGQSRAR